MRYANKALMVVMLVANLFAAEISSGYVETAHALRAAGSRTIVICGAAGKAETVMLDRSGEPVDRNDTDCAHCADCTLLPAFTDASNPPLQLAQAILRAGSPVTSETPKISRPVEYPSRGPPSQEVV